jgi:hypothetical protein
LFFRSKYVSLVSMKHRDAKRQDQLLGDLLEVRDILRGSLLQRMIRHRQGCPKCERGEGHPVSVLAVTYPGRRIRHISLSAEQVPQVRRQLDNYRQLKAALEQICELNQQALRADVADSKVRRRNRD